MEVHAKRLLAVLLAAVMIAGMLPVGVFATTEPGFSVTAGGTELTATDCDNSNWLLTAPEGTTEISVSLKNFSGEYFYLQSPHPTVSNMSYTCNSWGDDDMESFKGYATYDGATYCLDLACPYLKCTVKDTIEKFGFTQDSTATYYYFSIYDGDSWEMMYNLLLKVGGSGENTPVPAVSATPVISKQPISATYEQGADAAALTVTASVSAGTLTYAWYADGSDTVLSTTAQYTPSTETVGSKAYYVTVTGTESGKTPASVTSQKATVTVTEPAGDAPEQNGDGVYQLGTKEELFWFAKTVNKAKSISSGWSDEAYLDAELTADIDLEDEPWTPIGTVFYAGHFNGNNFTVSGLNITAESEEDAYVGFFADAEGAEIENLKLSGTITVTEDGAADSVGGIAGHALDSTLSNCRAEIDITVESESVTYVGGLIGSIEGEETTVQYCARLGDITTGSAGYVGGLIGYSHCEEKLSISCCYQKGNITTEADIVGGLIGYSDDYMLTVKHSYVSASIAGETLSSGLEQTGTITASGYCGDLFGCLGASDITLDGVYCITEIVDGCGNYNIYDLDEDFCALNVYDGTPEEFCAALNDGEDGAAYALAEDGDGWPILAWELKEGASPAEQEKALAEAKTAAKAEITALFTDTYKEADYEAADWTKMTGYRDKALTAVEAAKDTDAVTAALTTLKNELKAVPTAADRLAEYKKTACTAIEKAYYSQTTGTYSTTESGYKVELTKYIASAEKFGLMHGLKEQFLEELNGELKTLETTKNDGLTAVNAATSKADVDTEKDKAIAAMEKVLTDAKAKKADNGVSDKWDGTTQTQPSGAGTKASPYQIGTAAELAWFATAVNDGKKNLYATLTADIDLNEKDWTPIAKSFDDTNGYAGVFDGNGHKIHGLAVTVEKEGTRFFGGLFGNIGKNGVVKNVAVAGIVKQMLGNTNMNAMQKANYAVGGIAGRSSGIIYRCESSVVLTNGKTYSNCNYLGGIVGYQVDGIIESCTGYAILYQSSTANFQHCFGGVTGYSGGNSLIRYTDSYADIDLGNNVLGNIGGITATLEGQAQIRECRNFGTVVNGNGIAGNVLDQAGITYALNSGTVSGKSGIGESGIRPGAGIIGVLNSTGTVSYIYNDGSCVYGLVNTFKKGTIVHAESSSETSLWGTADAQHAFTDDCLKVETLTGYESTESTGELAWAKLEATRTLLGNLKSSTDKTYGTQSTSYNAIVLRYIRKVELAKSESEIKSILTEASAALNVVQTQLEAEKEAVIAEFEAYVAERVYDEDGTARINALLKEAKAAANAATTSAALTNVKEVYLGTQEQPGKFETECDTYNTKAKNELYNEFIYGKKYGAEDMAAMLSLYEQWAVRLDAAESVAEIDTVFAEARFAMNAAAEKLTEGEDAPDMDAAATAALTLAKDAAAKELSDLAESLKTSMQTLADSTNGKGYADGILTAIANVRTAHDSYMDTASAVEFKTCTDYAQIEAAKNAAAEAMREYAAQAERDVNALIAEAEASSDDTWDGTTVTEPKKDEDGVYRISDGAELAWLARELNAGHFQNGRVNAVLTRDIDLGYNEWTPIGLEGTDGKFFAGSFDGNGFTVKGLYFGAASASTYMGLFGVVQNGAEIKNLTVRGAIRPASVGSGKYIGGIVAKAYWNAVTLENCVSYVEITVGEITNVAGNPSYVGGLIGYAHSYAKLNITDCTFRGSVTVKKCNTNVVGIGGVVGRLDGTATLLRTVNYGEITVDKAVGVGGVVGKIGEYAGGQTVTFTDCANLGNVTNDAENVLDSAKGGTGGIAGNAEGTGKTISGCYNTGTITASKLAGGILGYGNFSSAKSVLKNCYNAGTLVGPNNQTASKIGSLVGYPFDGEYKDRLYVLEGTAQAAMGWKSKHGDRIYTVSAEELIEQFADGVRMVKSISDLNGGYPLFVWQLLESDNRRAVVDYLNGYYETSVKAYASSEQREEITEVLAEQSAVILAATDADTIITAYEAAMAAMDREVLLRNAKANARTALDGKLRAYLAKYPQLADALTALNTEIKSEIEAAQTPSEIDTILDRLDAAVVDLLIEDIGEIDNDLTEEEAKTAKEKIAIAEEAYNALTDAQKQQVSKFVTLREAKAAMDAYEKAYAADKAAADAVTEKIRAIGEVTLDSREAVEAALNAYNALTDRQKAMVSEEDRSTLLAAQERYNALLAEYNADVKAANHVIELINAIGTVTLDSKDAIDAATDAYAALTDAQKAMIPEASSTALRNAVAKYAELEAAYTADLKAAQEVTDLINAIGTVTLDSKDAVTAAINAYNALSDSQKKLVSEEAYSTLLAASERYGELVEAYNADVDAVTAVVNKINAIGTVTLDSEPAVSEADNAYAALTEAQKAMLPASAAETLAKAKEAYEKLASAYAADQKAAQEVTDLINAIGTVTLDSKTAIAAARAAYDALTETQKAMVTEQTAALLTAAEVQYNVLAKANESKPTEPTNAPVKDEPQTPTASNGENETTSEPEETATADGMPEPTEPDATEETAAPETEPNGNGGSNAAGKSFDWSIVLIACAIVAAALAVFGIIRWFMLAKNTKRK